MSDFIEKDGKKYVRVSTIIKPFNNLKGIDQAILNRKAIIGTEVHNAIDEDIDGDLSIISHNSIGYLQSFQKWRDIVQPSFLERKMRIYDDKKMVTGEIDGLVKLQGEEKAILVDYKTSASESPSSWNMQAHLYQYLLATIGKEISGRFFFIKLDKYGELPKVCQYKFDVLILGKCLAAIDSFWENVDTNVDV